MVRHEILLFLFCEVAVRHLTSAPRFDTTTLMFQNGGKHHHCESLSCRHFPITPLSIVYMKSEL